MPAPTPKPVKPTHRTSLCAGLLLIMLSTVVTAKSVTPPDDPSQSINYWKPHVIQAEADPAVAQAERVFSNLLRSWDSSRIAPSLYVVDSSAGPWAASLMDGNILLSRAAISTCQKQGEERAEHLLAFVLAHELAHQKADDLWHQKFFRLSGNQSPELQRKLLKGLDIDQDSIADLERREARADHDGLVMMATVGYDPYYITDQDDFFTAWVENIWQSSCTSGNGNGNANPMITSACEQAQTRATRSRTQLVTVANQTTLFELGLQAFIAGQWQDARGLFIGFGRDFPSRAVHSNIGLTHLAQALELLAANPGLLPVAGFYYPLLLDTQADAEPISGQVPTNKRGSPAIIKQQIHQHLVEATEYFDKAIRLQPSAREAYLYLAMSHLLDNNPFMLRGILQGKYLPQFGADPAVELFLAMTTALEDKPKQALKQFQALIQSLAQDTKPLSALPAELLTYAAHYNYAHYLAVQGQGDAAKQVWQDLAKQAQHSGQSLMFRLALNQLNPSTPAVPANGPTYIRKLRLGDRPDFARLNREAAQQSSFWHGGEQFNIYRFSDGARLVLGPQQQLLAAWQRDGVASTSPSLSANLALGDSADRPLKAYGVPTRRIHTIKGEYLAYDARGLAVHVVNDKVAGWFLYAAGDG